MDPAWDTPVDAGLQERFLRAQAKLFGFVAEPERTFASYPAERTDVQALYARAYAYNRQARIEQRNTNDRRTSNRTLADIRNRTTSGDDRNRTYTDRERNRTYSDRNRDRNYRDGDRNRTDRDRIYAGNNYRDRDRDQRSWRDRDQRNWSDRDHRRWDRRWRDNRTYDWQRYRNQNRIVFRIGTYYSPYRNYNYRRLNIGYSLDSLFYSNRYWINDPWNYRLPQTYGPYRWIRYYDDVLLVDMYSGEVVDVIYDFFW